jgi:hypothetical protein
MVVGPRYIPGGGLADPQTGGGWSPDTDQVPDASRITPPVLRPEERTGHDISLMLHLDAGVEAYDVACISHDTVVDSYGGTPMDISLAPEDTIPNKDFVLSWRVAGERPEVGVLSYADERGGFFTLVLQPQADFAPEEITPKEMIFCLDTSGSMSGLPIEKSKEAVKLALAEMGRNDTFQIIRFAGDSSTFKPEPVRATRANIAEAIAYIDELHGRGGTEMLKGIEASLSAPADPRRIRIIAFLTDGYIGNESQILARIQKKLGEARLFSFGIGSSVNRYLLRKMAQLGRGTAQFVRQDEDPEAAVRTFVDRISRPYLTDIGLHWGGLDVLKAYPPYVPDLFADQPVILHGRYGEAGEGVVSIRGFVAGQPWETAVPVTLAAGPTEHEVIATLWARAAIADLMDQMHRGEDPDIVDEITDLALTYRIVSKYTSFVAVEEKIVNRGGEQITVQVPVPMPEGTSFAGVFGALNGADKATAGFARGGGGGIGGGARGGGMRGGGRAGMATPPKATPSPGVPVLGDYVDARRVPGVEALTAAWIAVATSPDQTYGAQALYHLTRTARSQIGLPAGAAASVRLEDVIGLGEAEGMRVVVLSGTGAVGVSNEAAAALATYIEDGGFVIVDGGSAEFRSLVMVSLTRALKGAQLGQVRTDHAIFAGESMPFALTGGTLVRQSDGLWMGDRLAVFASTGALAEPWSDPTSPEAQPALERALRRRGKTNRGMLRGAQHDSGLGCKSRQDCGRRRRRPACVRPLDGHARVARG